MLSFAVFDDKGPANSWPQGLAYLFGGGDMPVQGSVRFEDGRLVCEKMITETVGIVTQFPVDAPTLAAGGSGPAHNPQPLGTLALKTCLLPDRDQPYLLPLELARHRIMIFLNKLEDWGLAALATDHPVMVAFEEARALFTSALTARTQALGQYTAEQAEFARKALAKAIEASELLALLGAERQLVARMAAEDPSMTGVRIR